MPKVLLVKMSSLGDVVHLLPALTDACAAIPDLQFDWVVERSFAPIAALHPAVRRVLPIELRKWRHAPLQARTAFVAFLEALQSERYDLVLDAQGLIKSAIVSTLAHGPRTGFSFVSAREPIASAVYTRRVRIPRDLHAIERLRQLMASALGYPMPGESVDFGVTARPARPTRAPARYLLFLHGTTWSSKQWPAHFWRALCQRATAAGWSVRLAFASADEQARAQRIAQHLEHVDLLPPTALLDLLPWIAHAGGVVSVDTGLGHVAAAFAVPTVMLFGPTDAQLTGGRGARTVSVCAAFACAPCLDRRCRYVGPAVPDDNGIAVAPPCFASVPPEHVWSALNEVMQR